MLLSHAFTPSMRSIGIDTGLTRTFTVNASFSKAHPRPVMHLFAPSQCRRSITLGALVFLGMLMQSSGVCPAAASEDGFVSLFNGKDLTGWDGMPGTWWVKDGAICSGGTTKNWLIWRGGEVGDFELRLRFRYSKGNSGVQVRSEDRGNWQVHGYQVEVAARAAMGLWHESLWTEQERRFLATAGQRVRIAPDGKREVGSIGDPDAIQSAYKENDWNELAVIGSGSQLLLFINGVLFSELIDLDRARSRLSGVIALQDHGRNCEAEFKDIRLKRLGGRSTPDKTPK